LSVTSVCDVLKATTVIHAAHRRGDYDFGISFALSSRPAELVALARRTATAPWLAEKNNFHPETNAAVARSRPQQLPWLTLRFNGDKQ
jgi:hypothetical protein